MSLPQRLTLLQPAVDAIYGLLGLQSKKIDEPREPRFTFLDKLPPELWFIIAGHLEPADRGWLALSTVSMFSILGDRCFLEWNAGRDIYEKARFLTGLDVHYPRHRLCFFCLIFHRRNDRENQHEFTCPKRPLDTTPFSYDRYARLGGLKALPFRAVQLAMRAHRFGIDYGITLKRFEHMCRNAYVNPEFRSMEQQNWETSYKAVISSNSHLLLRTSGVLYTWQLDRRADGIDNSQWLSANAEVFRRGVPACKHLAKKISWLIQDAHVSFATISSIARCPFCYTDYFFDLKPDRAVVITWADLGDGISPVEEEWSKLIGRVHSDQEDDPSLMILPCEETRIMKMFEEALTILDAPATEATPETEVAQC